MLEMNSLNPTSSSYKLHIHREIKSISINTFDYVVLRQSLSPPHHHLIWLYYQSIYYWNHNNKRIHFWGPDSRLIEQHLFICQPTPPPRWRLPLGRLDQEYMGWRVLGSQPASQVNYIRYLDYLERWSVEHESHITAPNPESPLIQTSRGAHWSTYQLPIDLWSQLLRAAFGQVQYISSFSHSAHTV